jgi:hypothetical protein
MFKVTDLMIKVVPDRGAGGTCGGECCSPCSSCSGTTGNPQESLTTLKVALHARLAQLAADPVFAE